MADRDVDSSSSAAQAGPPDSRLGLLRELGEQAVLEAIFRRGPVTRPEIASATGLSKPTVGAAVGRLEQAGMISAVGPQHGRRGRSPIAYVVRDSAGFVVGLDLGGTNIRAGAADVFGEMIYDELEPTTKAGGRGLAAQIAAVAVRAVERGRATHDRLLAIAISTPGVVDRETGRVRLAYNLSAGRHVGSAQRGRHALRGPRPHRQQHQPGRAGREVVRAGPGRVDDGVHRDRRRRGDGDHHARRARPWRPRGGGRDRLPAARRGPLRPPAQAARRIGGRDRGGGRARRLRRSGAGPVR